MLYFSEKRREGEWISFSPRSLGGGTVHVNLSHSVNVFSSSPPPSLHTLSGVFLGFGKFFVCVCVVFFFFSSVADQDQPKNIHDKKCVCIISSSRRSFDLWKRKKRESKREK